MEGKERRSRRVRGQKRTTGKVHSPGPSRLMESDHALGFTTEISSGNVARPRTRVNRVFDMRPLTERT